MASQSAIKTALDILEGGWPSLVVEWRKNLNWRGAFTRMASTAKNEHLIAAARRLEKETEISRYKNLISIMAEHVESVQKLQAPSTKIETLSEIADRSPEEHRRGLEKIRALRQTLEKRTELPMTPTTRRPQSK